MCFQLAATLLFIRSSNILANPALAVFRWTVIYRQKEQYTDRRSRDIGTE
jgi:hypothetical protein